MRIMYVLTKSSVQTEDEETVWFGVADESRNFGDFTDDMTKAVSFVELLNKEKVEAVHVRDIIEDMFY